ncbi:putative FAD-binding PCMH-type domain-containing protein [Seiridium cardinale]
MRPSDVQRVLALAHTPNITKIFGPSLSADAGMYLASDANYSAQVSQRWSIHAAPSYIGTIKPATIEDVQNIVKIAPKHDIPFLATVGGHGISNHLASLQDGLQIDLANFNGVEFDASSAQLTVGGAAKFSQINDILYDSGYQFLFKVPKAVNNGNVVNANYFFPAHQVGSVFKVIRSLNSKFPEDLALNIFTSYDPKSDQFPGLTYLETSYFDVDDTKACGRRQHINMYSIAARKTDASALETFANDLSDLSRTNNNVTTSLVVHRFATQAVLRVPDEDSAYPYRNVQMHMQVPSNQLEAELHDGRQDHDVDIFLQSARAKLNEGNGFDNKSVYVNFAHGDEGPETWYGVRKLEKLGRLKGK